MYNDRPPSQSAGKQLQNNGSQHPQNQKQPKPQQKPLPRPEPQPQPHQQHQQHHQQQQQQCSTPKPPPPPPPKQPQHHQPRHQLPHQRPPEANFVNRLLESLHLGDLDAGDLLLLGMLFFLWHQKADEELLIALGLLLIL